MAWIAKPSGSARIERRDEPYLTAAMRDRITKEIMPRYETRLACTLPCLHMVQHAYGWVPPQAMEEIADLLGITPADVLDTASFYEEFWLKPRGRHLVAVCRSIACEFCGQEAITRAFCETLGIEVGETTEDGQFTLVELECLGSCDTAPVALVDEQLHEGLTPEQVTRIIDEVRARDTGAAGERGHDGPA